MRYLSIKNHKAHQHYKDRRPPWIKLHVAILDDYAFSCLQDASKAHLLLLGVLASKMDNRIPYDADFLARKLGATEPVDVEVLVAYGFVTVSEDDASMLLAPRKHLPIVETETETETETEGETEKALGAGAPEPPAVAVVRTRPPRTFPPWVRTGVPMWEMSVGSMTPARFFKALGPSVAIHGWDTVWSDAQGWVRQKQESGKAPKIEWYADEVNARLGRASKPIVDEWGVPTEYGDRLTKPQMAR